MPMNPAKLFKTIFFKGGALLLAAGLMAVLTKNHLSGERLFADKRWREQIKREVYQEISEEIYTLLKKEVKAEFEDYIAGHPQLTLAGEQQAPSPDGVPARRVSISSAVRAAVREVIRGQGNSRQSLADPDLDQYWAGRGIEPNLAVAPGVYKRELTLAKAQSNTQASDTITTEDHNPSGGGKERTDSIERVLQQRGSVLLPKGTLQIEPSVTWSHFSSNRINIDGLLLLDVFAIGEISTETVERDIFIQNFAFKYGLLNNFQADLRVPVREEFDRITRTSGTETTNSASGIGDIDLSISRQIGWEKGWQPDVIASVGVKPPTGQEPYNREIGMGTGHWAIRGALIMAKSSDPTVIFGSLNYASVLSG